MDVLASAIANARALPQRVVFPEWGAPHIREAREVLISDGICEPVPVAEPDADQLAAIIAARGLDERVAQRMLSRPLIRAAAMVACGQAEALVAGIETPTKKVIEAALLAIGLADDVTQPSSFFLMIFPDGRTMIFADCAATVEPDSEGLASIAKASEASAKALLGKADVALLSYSTGTSGVGPSVDLVRDAALMTGFSGPLQADAAVNSVVASAKGVEAGSANVLIFPDLNSGNIAYKLCQQLAGASAFGPFLQGFRRPICDLSRGASANDIVAATALTLSLDRQPS